MDVSQIRSAEDLRRYETELRNSADSDLYSLNESQRQLEERLAEIETEIDRQEKRWESLLAANRKLYSVNQKLRHQLEAERASFRRQAAEQKAREEALECELQQLSEMYSEIISLIETKIPDLYQSIAAKMA